MEKEAVFSRAKGSLWRQILWFALPIAAASILQQLFNSTDTAVVGRFAGSAALAAVGSTAPVANLCITILMGLSIGANVKIAQAVGAWDEKAVRETIDTSAVIAVLSGICLMLVGELIAPWLLSVMGTPADILDLAVLYVRIYFLGMPFLMIYNFEAAILRGSGDTKRPLYCLLISGVVNLGLNLLFVIVFEMGVAGVAWATLIADVVNAALLLIVLIRGEGAIRLNTDVRHLKLSLRVAGFVFKIGIPAAVQGMMFDIANVVIQAGFNSLGSKVVAAATIGLNVEIFVYYLIEGFAQAAVTFNGQGLGAGDFNRCRRASKDSMILGAICTVLMAGSFLLFAKPTAGIFTSDAEVLRLAVERMWIILPFELFHMTIEILSGALRGLGYSTLPAAISAVFICGTRLLWISFVFPMDRTFPGLLKAYPVSWMLTALATLLAFLIILRRQEKRFRV